MSKMGGPRQQRDSWGKLPGPFLHLLCKWKTVINEFSIDSANHVDFLKNVSQRIESRRDVSTVAVAASQW